MKKRVVRHTTIAAVAVAGTVALTACNSGASGVTTPSAPATASTTPAIPTLRTPPLGTPTGGDTMPKATPNGTHLKFGQPAVIDSSDTYKVGTFRLKVNSLVAAPASAYSKANVNKANGVLYYLVFDTTYFGGSDEFEPNLISDDALTPVVAHSEHETSIGTPDHDLPGCTKTNDDDMKPGETRPVCFVYQVTGKAPTTVAWDDNDGVRITWSK